MVIGDNVISFLFFVFVFDKAYGNKSSYRKSLVTALRLAILYLTLPFFIILDRIFVLPIFIFIVRKGSVVVSFKLYFTTSVTTTEGLAELKDAVTRGTIVPYTVRSLKIVTEVDPINGSSISLTISMAPVTKTSSSSSGELENLILTHSLQFVGDEWARGVTVSSN